MKGTVIVLGGRKSDDAGLRNILIGHMSPFSSVYAVPLGGAVRQSGILAFYSRTRGSVVRDPYKSTESNEE